MENSEENIDEELDSDDELVLDIDCSFGLDQGSLTCQKYDGQKDENQTNDHSRALTETQEEIPSTAHDPPGESQQRTQIGISSPTLTSNLNDTDASKSNPNVATNSHGTKHDEKRCFTTSKCFEISTCNKQDNNSGAYDVNITKESVPSPYQAIATSRQAATICSPITHNTIVDVPSEAHFITSLRNVTKREENPQNDILPPSFPYITSTDYSGVPPFYVSSSDIEKDIKSLTEAVSLHQNEIQRLILEAERNERQKQENLTQISLLNQKRTRIKVLDDLTESCIHICHGNIQKAEEFSQEASLFALNTLINCLENKKVDIKVEVNRFMEKFGISTAIDPSTLDPECLDTDVETNTPGTSKTQLTLDSDFTSSLKND